MMLSKRAKDALMSVVSGQLFASSVVGGTTGVVVSVFSGDVPTQEQLNTLYTSTVTMTSFPSVADLNGKITALGKTLLASSYLSPTDVVGLSRTTRKYLLSGKTLAASASGTASFLVVAPSTSASVSTAIYVFDLAKAEPDILIKDRNIVAGQLIYLQDISIDYLLGVQR